MQRSKLRASVEQVLKEVPVDAGTQETPLLAPQENQGPCSGPCRRTPSFDRGRAASGRTGSARDSRLLPCPARHADPALRPSYALLGLQQARRNATCRTRSPWRQRLSRRRVGRRTDLLVGRQGREDGEGWSHLLLRGGWGRRGDRWEGWRRCRETEEVEGAVEEGPVERRNDPQRSAGTDSRLACSS